LTVLLPAQTQMAEDTNTPP